MEFGCGGTISKRIRNGDEAKQIVFCLSEEMGIDKLTRKTEVIRAARVLGINGTMIHHYPHRQLDKARQSILDGLIKVKDEYDPDIIYTPATGDFHQDHQVVTQEAIRAFRDRTILGYEDPWNNLSMMHSMFEILQPVDIVKKWQSIKEHTSVLGRRAYHNEVFIKSLATVRGAQVNADDAEMFEVIRCVLR
jgi:LmbE family N-acetylglucosaminyl deacetylase